MDDQKTQGDINQLLNKITNLAQTGQKTEGYSEYIDKLIEEKKYPDLTPEVREEMKKDLMTRLDDFIAARIIAGLSDTDVLTFESMLNDAKPEGEIQKFVSDHIPDFVNFLTNVLLEFRGIYLGLINSPVIPEDGKEVPTTIKSGVKVG